MRALRQCFAVVFNHDVIEDNGDESPYLNKLAVEFSKEDLSFLQGAMKLDSRDRLSARELSLILSLVHFNNSSCSYESFARDLVPYSSSLSSSRT